MQATIQKWGNSQGIRIPKAFLDALGMVENDFVELNRVDDKIFVAQVPAGAAGIRLRRLCEGEMEAGT
nr:AbrB/MazE/SpoVT family DNA-binding domain-containing protein [uncultured Acetatifactor sp.]